MNDQKKTGDSDYLQGVRGLAFGRCLHRWVSWTPSIFIPQYLLPSLRSTDFAFGETPCVNQNAWVKLNTLHPGLKNVSKTQSNQCFSGPYKQWLAQDYNSEQMKFSSGDFLKAIIKCETKNRKAEAMATILQL